MKHLAKIQSEFLKHAGWNDQSYEYQKDYLKRHPKSKRKITAKPGKMKANSNDDNLKSDLKSLDEAAKILQIKSSISSDLKKISENEKSKVIKEAIEATNSDNDTHDKWRQYDAKQSAFSQMAKGYKKLNRPKEAKESEDKAEKFKAVKNLMTTFRLFKNAIDNPQSGHSKEAIEKAKEICSKFGIKPETSLAP
jgi:hypothetical protein